MEALSGQELANLRNFLQEATLPSDLSTFAARLLPVINNLVPGDVVCFAQVDPAEERVISQITYASGVEAPQDTEVFERYMMSHPVFQHWSATGQSSAARTSGLISKHKWHEYELYQEYYKHWRCEDSLAIGLPAPPGLVACFCIERGRAFNDREVLLMETVRPYVTNLYRNIEAFSLLSQAGTIHGGSWILLDVRGRPMAASDAAWNTLWAHFPDPQGRQDALPERVAHWVSTRLNHSEPGAGLPPADTPFVDVCSNGSTLTIRIMKGLATGEQALLLLQDQALAKEIDRSPAGLTHREMEVLAHARDGLTAAEIGDLLCISRRTVEKHLEHIYNKLGVYRRVAAVTRIFQA